ncbi:MAG: rhodanese-like domain-containing protein [Gammaproteobacteria bacterium]|nr:rhodanese-like domain-containing protein [Gammaproteobacteria bacterium]
MIFKQFYEPSLGHASYLLGSEETGEALVLDVRRDVDSYYDFAREQSLRIAYAADTHQHNDYLTGITQLHSKAPVELLSGARAQLGYKTQPLQDSERLTMGEIEFETLHTPGHTPEHISLLVRDKSRGDDPVMLLSGGALLVADVARPDLLGDEAEKRRNAKAMCKTLKEKILPLPDHVLVYPTHVAGSLCGGNIGSMLVTTIGYERRLNDMLAHIDNESDFEDRCLDLGPLPTVPPYWRRMRKQNQDGPALLGTLSEPPALQPKEFARRITEGALVVDCRSPEAYAGAHVPGSLNVGVGTSFPTWAGSILPEEADLLLVVDDPGQLWDIYWKLLRIGYREPAGWLAGGMMAWRTSAQPLGSLPQWTPKELDARRRDRDDLFILDVRQPAEWQAGHVPDAHHISGSDLPAQLEDVPKDKPIAVYCGSGYRSSVAASLLRRSGHRNVYNVIGGFTAWEAEQLPVAGH